MRVVDPAGARVLLLGLRKFVLLLGHLLVGHVALSLVGDACRALTFVVDACSLDGGCHRTSLFRLALHGARAAFSLEGPRVGVSGRLVQAFKVVGGGLLAELVRAVVVVRVANDHAIVIRMVLWVVAHHAHTSRIIVHARQLKRLVRLGNSIRAGFNLSLLIPVNSQYFSAVDDN